VIDPFRLPFVQRAELEVILLAVGAGLLGTWIVVRGMAFYAHAVGTAAFPGLVLADGLGFAAPLGAFGVALAFAVGMWRLSRGHTEDQDSLTALALVGALVVGVILASDVFHSGSNIETLLFGSLLLTGASDLLLAAAASALVVITTLLFGRRWLAFGFDASSARALGIDRPWAEATLLVLIALVAVAALSITGALLATAILVVPAATVRIWSKRLVSWQVQSIGLVALEGTAGLWLSVRTNAPPGATIATLAGGVFVVAAVARTVWDRRRRVAPLVAAVVALTVFCVACGSNAGSGSGNLDVVATTTQIGDWARLVGGSAISVTQLLQPNTDPHDYEPRPSDVTATAAADIVFENGDNLDAWMADVVRNAGGSPQVVDLGQKIPVKVPGETSGPEASRYDPHWWHDPVNAEEAVGQIRDVLDAADPEHGSTFDANAKAYLAELKTLDSGITACFTHVPADERKLVTDHDAFNYFAKRYEIQVVGAVIPSQTTQAEPNAKQLQALVDLIRKEHVKAVFPESSLSPKLAQAIANETGASADYTLYGDTLGPAESSGATYITMEAANADEMVKGFTGGTDSCTIAGVSGS
jgi:ABC-type Zn uptake system ZnuABC Zn-binding protein ZnuA/ABC-type Mn2+/Zn2+ transport system permease subunit